MGDVTNVRVEAFCEYIREEVVNNSYEALYNCIGLSNTTGDDIQKSADGSYQNLQGFDYNHSKNFFADILRTKKVATLELERYTQNIIRRVAREKNVKENQVKVKTEITFDNSGQPFGYGWRSLRHLFGGK